jgi:hypothetical protein
VPQWSPDGSRLLFLSGEHNDCHRLAKGRRAMGASWQPRAALNLGWIQGGIV